MIRIPLSEEERLREIDALIAELEGWRWHVGSGPTQIEGIDAEWLLPDGMKLSQVRREDAEAIDLGSEVSRWTIKALPHYSTSMDAAFALVQHLGGIELRRATDGMWHARLPVASKPEAKWPKGRDRRPALAICRARFALVGRAL